MPTARRAQLKAPSPPEWWTNGPRSLCPPPLSLGYVLNEITLGSLQETQGLNSLMGPPSSWLLNACVSAAPRVLSQPAVGLQDTPWAGGGEEVMDSRACSCIWIPEWRQMTIQVMPGTVTEATIKLRWMSASWLITTSWHVLFPESLCVCNLSLHTKPKFVKNYRR